MGFDDPVRRLNSLREYLQAFIMRSLHESEAARAIAFVGGTALRFLEDLPRFSEDLDFSQVLTDGYDPVRWLRKLKRDLDLAGFDSAVRWIDRTPVQVAWIRTASLLAEAGLSGHSEHKLRLPDMVRWPQLPESKSSRFSGSFWVNMRLSRFIATFSADKGHDT